MGGSRREKQFVLFRFRKKRQTKISIIKLNDEYGDIICEQTELLKEIKIYYEQVYSTEKANKESLEHYILNSEIENEKDENDKLTCDGKVTVEECSYPAQKMKINKSSGLNGLTIEFYRLFWNKLKYILVDVLNKGNDGQCLIYSQRTSILA
jgi:hypothetical protein